MKSKIFFIILLLIKGFDIQAQVQKTNSTPIILGRTEEIYSNELKEKRLLNIYFPEGYDENGKEKYPVIYLLDGSIDEDFIHIVGLVQYNNFSWIDRVPKSIVIGIANVNRRRDFTSLTSIASDLKHAPQAGGSANFIKFIEKELQPYIYNHLNVNDEKTIIGQSLGGLLATEILFTKPHLFDKYIIISPSLWWNDGALLKSNPEILTEKLNDSIAVYIGVGKEGLAPSEIPHVMEVDANLLYEKIKNANSKSLKVDFDYLPNENHATVTHPAVFNAFRILYPEKNH